MREKCLRLSHQEIFLLNKEELFEALYKHFHLHFIGFNGNRLNIERSEDSEDDVMETEITQYDEHNLEEFRGFCKRLHNTQVILLMEPVITRLLFSEIQKYVDNNCSNQWEEPALDPLIEWMDTSIFQWLEMILDNNVLLKKECTGSSMENLFSFELWKKRIKFYMYDAFAQLRIKELFDIISEYPDSEPALYDLKEAMEHIDRQTNLIVTLTQVFSARLLIPGATTPDIIRVFVLMTKSMRIVDPSGVVFNSIGEPIRDYLSRRDDTIRCIVASLTGDDGSGGASIVPELQEELQTAASVDPLDFEGESEDELDDEETAWRPDPIYPVLYDSRFTGSVTSKVHARRTRDIISSLVNIYGSKDLFVQEYKKMLADRLLNITDYDTEKEVVNLELLKLRFGEASLHDCKVMLQDIQESRFTNQNIHSRLSTDYPLDMTIVSHLFWPSFREDTLIIPEDIQAWMDCYGSHFEALKKPRRLAWMPHLGTVDVELVFPGTDEEEEIIREYSVTPVHAVIIHHFGEKDTWAIGDLAKKLDISTDQLRKKISYWVGQGVLREQSEKGVYCILDMPEDVLPMGILGDGEEDGYATPSAQEEEQEWQMVTQFVTMMLKNFGKLPLNRIRDNLSYTMPDYDRNIHELRSHLDTLVRDDVLEMVDGQYTIKE